MRQLIGSIVSNRYQIISPLGIGGMSVVFRAKDLKDDREVSLKVLRADRVADSESLRRFFNESRAIALLSHPNIVNVYDVNFEGKIQYIVMEYVDGVTLKDRMDQKGALSISESIHYLRQILSALAHAHERGVVHHDIKPQNILLFSDATVKITDFGIASVPTFEEDSPSDEAIGSVHYISPEQARGDVTDERSDLYSVGIMMYNMLTGALPFDSESPTDVARMQVEKPPYPPCSLDPELPMGFQQVIFRALAKNPSERYQKAEDMLRDLIRLDEDPATIFPYPKEYKLPARKRPRRRGLAGYIRSFFPENEISYRHIRNNALSVLCGLLVAILVIIPGIALMASIVSNRYQEYVDVPSYVGRVYEDVEVDYSLSGNFKFDVQYAYDSSVETGVILEQVPAAGTSVAAGTTVTVTVSKGSRMVAVPELIGSSEAKAISTLKSSGLTYVIKTKVVSQTQKTGVVLSCSPVAGTEVKEGSQITFTIGVHAAATQTVMPNVIGMTKENAITTLYKKNLTLVSVTEAYSATVEKGKVIAQSIPADTTVGLEETIILTISMGIQG